MFKRYQGEETAERENEERKIVKSTTTTGTYSPQGNRIASRPYVKEPIRNEAPPRIYENATPAEPVVPATPAAPAAPQVTPPQHDGYNEGWSESTVQLTSEEPETTLGEGVSFKGELSFQRLLRIDGQFEGKLMSSGKLVVGPKGILKSDDIQLREAIIEGTVEGNLVVEDRVELRGDAVIRGNIEAQSLSVDEGVSITGHVKVVPLKDSFEEN